MPSPESREQRIGEVSKKRIWPIGSLVIGLIFLLVMAWLNVVSYTFDITDIKNVVNRMESL